MSRHTDTRRQWRHKREKAGRTDLGGVAMSKPVKRSVTVLLFVVAAVSAFFILRPSDSHIVEIVQDGEVLYTLDLDSTNAKMITVSYEGGSSNTITIQNGEIWVSEAECPDQTCVKMGKLRSEHLPIVCLPNRLIIRFVK